jgi:hypothetical protein
MIHRTPDAHSPSSTTSEFSESYPNPYSRRNPNGTQTLLVRRPNVQVRQAPGERHRRRRRRRGFHVNRERKRYISNSLSTLPRIWTRTRMWSQAMLLTFIQAATKRTLRSNTRTNRVGARLSHTRAGQAAIGARVPSMPTTRRYLRRGRTRTPPLRPFPLQKGTTTQSPPLAHGFPALPLQDRRT